MIIIQPISTRKKILLTAAAAVLLVVFSFLGAPLLRVLQHSLGRYWFWFSGILVSAPLVFIGLAPIAFLVFGLWIVVGLYGELEGQGKAGFWSAFVASALGSAVSVGGPVLALQATGEDWIGALRENLQNVLGQNLSSSQATSWLAGVTIDADFLLSQTPSMMAIIIISSLAFALILDRRVAFMTGVRFERVASGLRPLEFRLPDGMVFIAMFSFLLSFLKVGVPLVSIISLNVFNVLVAAYFFQGLAVLETAFLVFRTGFFVRALIYVFIVGQLFFILSLVGLVDYWVDFRKRLRGMSKFGSSPSNGEQI